MKKIITLFTTLFLLCIFAVPSFAAEGEEIKMMKRYDENSTEVFYQYRDDIVEAYFCNSLDGLDESNRLQWSVGLYSGMGIKAWLVKNEDKSTYNDTKYNLYIGAVGDYYFNDNMSYYFKDFTSLEKISGFQNVSTTLLTNADCMFSGCSKLNSLDLTSWNTSKVVTMSRMFYDCSAVEELDLSSFSADSLTTIHYMFGNCTALKTIFASDKWKLREDITGFNTFVNCVELEGNIDFNANKVSCAYATLDGYFTDKKNPSDDGPETPEEKPGAKLDKTIKAYGIADETDFNAYKDSIVTVNFESSINRTDPIDDWDVSTKQDGSVWAWIKLNTTETASAGATRYDLYIAGNGGLNANPDSSYMFYEYRNLKSVNGTQNLNTSYATDMRYMFYRCDALQSVNLSSFDTSSVKNMSNMFGFCYKLKSADLSSLDTSKVTDIANLFYYCTSLEEVNLSGLDLSKVETASVIFVECPVKKIVADDIILCDKTVDIFKNTYERKITLEEISLKNADISAVTNLSKMFENCDGLTTLDLTSFDLLGVKDMSYMFYGCDNLETVFFGETKAIDVNNMSYMFFGCSKLKTADFSGVSTGSIKNMSYMFYNCGSLQTLNFGKFNTALLQNLDQTFRDCTNLTRIYVGENWSIKAVSSGNSTFKGCDKLVGAVSYAVVGDVTYRAATLNGYLTPVDPTVEIPPVEELPGADDEEEEPEKLNFIQRIIQWFKNLFERLFGKRD